MSARELVVVDVMGYCVSERERNAEREFPSRVLTEKRDGYAGPNEGSTTAVASGR